MKKNILAENMRRFGTKNLSETNLQDLENKLGFDSGANRDPKTGNLSNNGPNQNQTKYTNKGLAQKAYDKLYDLTDDFHGDYPLNYLDDNLPSELEEISDRFFDDNDLLTPEEDKKLATFFMQIVQELKNELRFG